MSSPALASARTAAVRQRLTRLALIFLSLYAAASMVGGIVLAEVALHPPRRPITAEQVARAKFIAQQESFSLQDIQIQSSDGDTLRGWFLRPKGNASDVVLLLHGVADNRLGMSGYALFLLQNGYAVLLPDARAHGASGGEFASYGLRESDDIHRWVGWIKGNESARCVYGFGESMGAAQLLQSLAQENRFCAVIGESSFASFREVAYDRVGQPFHLGPWLGWTFFRPLIEVAFLYSRVHYGLDFERASPEEVVATTKVPVFLIHGLEDRNIPPRHSESIKGRNPSVVLWEVPAAVHTGAYSAAPQQFERRLLDWFVSHR
jgi:dipeptidyl aminopeptidase/acylaminoacyl peptidase